MTSTVLLSADTLKVPGRIESSDLADIGIDIEVVGANDVPGPWDAFSHLPLSAQPTIQRPSIGLALRIRSGGIRTTLIDHDGEHIHLNPGMIGPFEDGTNIFYWADSPVLADLAILSVEVVEDPEP